MPARKSCFIFFAREFAEGGWGRSGGWTNNLTALLIECGWEAIRKIVVAHQTKQHQDKNTISSKLSSSGFRTRQAL